MGEKVWRSFLGTVVLFVCLVVLRLLNGLPLANALVEAVFISALALGIFVIVLIVIDTFRGEE